MVAALLALTALAFETAPCDGVPTTRSARAIANDNRLPAGELRNGVLTVRLTMREAAWHPDGPNGCGLRVHAFAEEGKPAGIPGPLLRVPVGTEVRVILRNSLGEAVRVRGLIDRPLDWQTIGPPRAQAAMDSLAVEIAQDEVREIRFRATVPGNFYYWGKRSAGDTAWRQNPGRLRPDLAGDEDGQLVGALIVDASGVASNDRVFVLTHTRYPGTRTTEDPPTAREVNAVNGMSWPHTERISASIGDTLRWRVLNPAATSHVMHLHGFYYRILNRGGVSAYDSTYARSRQDLVVSESMAPNRTMSLEWVPEKPGNWLFHCHFLVHMSPAQRVARAFGSERTPENAAHAAHDESAMAGPIVAINVGATRAAPTSTAVPARTLRLFATERAGVFGIRPAFGFVLQSGNTAPAPDSIRIPGTPIMLTRGEPTQITVVNRLRTPIGVHWHGIELESYFDGVPGVSGVPGRLAPAIQPGDSFVVRMTPPRAGTFMYHVHSEQFEELVSGLYGPLVVLDPGGEFSPERDHLFMISNGGPGAPHSTIFVNGSESPAGIQMKRGVAQRLRFMSIPANGEYSVRLLDGADTVQWKQIARDGADLPEERRFLTAAQARVDVGITKDFEFTPEKAGELVLEVTLRVRGRATRVLIRVID